jgi:predicted DNA-binding ribbon-helix-helix protein
LERECWQALEVLAYEDGWNNWREFFYMRDLPERPQDMPLASFVRQSITRYLFEEYDWRRSVP